MSMIDPLNHLGSIWYLSEPSNIPYFPNQFLALDFFCCFLQQDGSRFCSQIDRQYMYYYLPPWIFEALTNFIGKLALILKGKDTFIKFELKTSKVWLHICANQVLVAS